MIVVGLDLSLTGTGVAVIDSRIRAPRVHLLKSSAQARVPKPNHKGRAKNPGLVPVWDREERIRVMCSRVKLALPRYADLVVIEAPSYGSTGGAAHDRAGLWWQVVSAAAQRGPIAEVAPRTRALYATGDGNAAKVSVVRASVTAYELSFVDDNLVDAMVLAAMGCRYLGHPIEKQDPTARQLSAMDSVLWPKPKGKA